MYLLAPMNMLVMLEIIFWFNTLNTIFVIHVVSCPMHCVPLNVSEGDVSIKLKKKVVLRPPKVVHRKVCAAAVMCSDGLEQVSGPPKLYCGASTTGWVDGSNAVNMAELVCG